MLILQIFRQNNFYLPDMRCKFSFAIIFFRNTIEAKFYKYILELGCILLLLPSLLRLSFVASAIFLPKEQNSVPTFVSEIISS